MKKLWADSNLYIHYYKDKCILILLHVDDLIIIRDDYEGINRINRKLLSKFEITSLELIRLYLRVEFKYSQKK